MSALTISRSRTFSIPLDPCGANFNHHSSPTESDREGLLVKIAALYAPKRGADWYNRKVGSRWDPLGMPMGSCA